MLILGTMQGWKMYSRTTLNDWLTFTINWEVALMTIICSKLPYCSYDDHIFTIPDKNAALNRSSEYETILTIIDVYIGGYVKYEICSILTSVNVELLPLYWVNRFYSELIFLLLKVIILWIKFLLLYWRGHDIIFWFWLLLHNIWFLCFLHFYFLL